MVSLIYRLRQCPGRCTAAHLRKGRRESAIQSILYGIVSSITTPSAGERPVHTESHGDDAHHAREAHLRLRLVIQAIALGAPPLEPSRMAKSFDTDRFDPRRTSWKRFRRLHVSATCRFPSNLFDIPVGRRPCGRIRRSTARPGEKVQRGPWPRHACACRE